MSKKKSGVTRIMLPLLIVVILAISSVIWFGNTLKNHLAVNTCSTLSEVVSQQSFNFYSTLQSEKSTLQMMARIFQRSSPDGESSVALLNDILQNTGFERLAVCDIEGKGINNKGEVVDISNRAYFENLLNGETVISEPLSASYNDQDVVAIATPIMNDKKQVTGAIVGSYPSNKLGNLFLSSFDGKGYAYIVNPDGLIISKSTNDFSLVNTPNLFTEMQNAKFYANDDLATIKQNMVMGLAGHSKYEIYGQSRIMHYSPLNVNGWYLISAVPEDILSAQANQILVESNILTLLIVIFCIVIVAYIYRSQRGHISEISSIAFVDKLTGIRNNNKLNVDGAALLEKKDKKSWAFVLIDVNKMKLFNDTFGYDMGDELLKRIATTLEGALGVDEIAARVGSDEFCALMEYDDKQTITDRVKSVLDDVERQFHNGRTRSYNLTFSAGIYIIESTDKNMDVIADKARYVHRSIKQTNANPIKFYDESIKNKIARQKQIEDIMAAALEDEEFCVFLQPKYDLESEKLMGAEALVRWKRRDGTMIYPNDFIPIFEQNGFIVRLDMYMFEKTCQLIKAWELAGIEPVTVSVNFSRVHLQNDSFVTDLHSIAVDCEVKPEYLEIELTESTMFDNEELMLDVVRQLHALGYTVSMDDFGSGYSSLGLLKNLPVDVIKLDRTFFTSYMDFHRAKMVISSVIDMAKKLDIHTVAEGVETQEQIDLLRELNCDVVQGYYFAKPMSTADFNERYF